MVGYGKTNEKMEEFLDLVRLKEGHKLCLVTSTQEIVGRSVQNVGEFYHGVCTRFSFPTEKLSEGRPGEVGPVCELRRRKSFICHQRFNSLDEDSGVDYFSAFALFRFCRLIHAPMYIRKYAPVQVSNA